MSETKRPHGSRFRDALVIINPGACNPSGVALSIADACREMREHEKVDTRKRTPYGTIPPPCLHRSRRGPQPARHGQRAQGREQGFSRPSTPNAIVALVCARGGNMPADCSQSPLIGRWAGQRVLIQGDYAEDDD